jgi:hypothetical protein
MSPGVQRFGEQFLPPGGVSGEREKGKGRGDRGLYIGTGWGRNGQASMRIEEGSNRCGGSVTGVELGLRRKTTDGWGPLSVRVREGRVYRFGIF